MKPYSFMTFVNIGNSIKGIEPVLINFKISAGCLKISITWVMIYSLNSMKWNLSLLSVGDINNFKLSLAPVKLLLWCWINYWSSPLFFWFCPTHMTPVFSISLVGIIPSLVCIYMIIYTWCGRLNFNLCIPICVYGIHIYVLASLKPPFKEVKKTVQMCLMASLLLGRFY